MHLLIILPFLFLLLVGLPCGCDGKHFSGVLQTESNWQFLTRFCFLPDQGSLQFTVRYPVSYMTQSMLLYWDKPNLWDSVYKTDMNCTQKESQLDAQSSQLFPLSANKGLCRPVDNGTALLCESPEYRFSSARERWWFIVISNCHARGGLLLNYDMWLRNGHRGNIFREHFSADEIYILEFNIGFLLLQSVLLVLAVLISIRLKKKQLFHTTYKIFLASAGLFLGSILMTCITYLSYGVTGVKSSFLYYLSAALQASATIAFVLMLLLLSLGFTITCGRLPAWSTALISVFMTAFLLGYVALFVVEAVTFDPALVLYRWESQPGYGLLALILAAWAFYMASCVYSFVRHKRKRAFYLPMLLFFSAWFVGAPIAVAVNMTRVPAHMREKIVNFVELVVLFAAQLFYLILTRPTVANANFPFHIKTSQIDVISFEEAGQRSEDDSSLDQHPTGGSKQRHQHPCAPSSAAYDLPDGTSPAFTDFSIFTVFAGTGGGHHLMTATATQQQPHHQQPQQQPPPRPPPPPPPRDQSLGRHGGGGGGGTDVGGSPSCQERLLVSQNQQQPHQQHQQQQPPVYEEILQDGCEAAVMGFNNGSGGLVGRSRMTGHGLL